MNLGPVELVIILLIVVLLLGPGRIAQPTLRRACMGPP
ncbi:MAG: twin-arginine translocase TatA/TatE family subunit [Chloroflexi bacterium]|nr:twin-arginine translocase TatA/TatE family subunit [Chloroflexota bacterium]